MDKFLLKFLFISTVSVLFAAGYANSAFAVPKKNGRKIAKNETHEAAQQKDQNAPQQKNEQQAKSSHTMSLRASSTPKVVDSETTRREKHLSALVGGTYSYASVGTVFTGPTLTGQYLLSSQNILDVSYSNATGISSLAGLLLSDKETLNEVNGSYRRYFGNSFYLGVGGGYTMIDSQRGGRRSVDGKYSKFTSSSDYFNLSSRIGNQWTMSWFTLGVDWIKVAYYNRMNTTYNSTVEDMERAEIYTGDFLDMNQTLTYSASVYLGVCF
ncbi:MAG: hypothetical protein HQK54_17660 [Oligoflexales bacterium]|nr:hypothetical protein [Oligoflexales bacterium]